MYCNQTVRWFKMKLGTQIGLGPGHIVLDEDPAPLPQTGTAPSFRPYLLWPNGWIDQDSTWHGGGPRSRPHCARWGPSCPSPKMGYTRKFSAHFYCDQTAGCINMSLGMEIGLGPGHIVQDGDPPPFPLKGHSPQFLDYVRCGQRAGWIKMSLGTEVGLGPGDVVLD